MSYKTKYKPTNQHKYKGRKDNIVARSSWERDMMYHLDHNPNVLEWSSEEIVVPYTSPLDGKRHRYFVDFWVKMKTKEGEIKEALIEVKPRKETIEPKKPKNASRRYTKQVAKYMVNEAKWKAADAYCKFAGMEFRIMTEYDIYGPGGKKYARRKKSSRKKK